MARKSTLTPEEREARKKESDKKSGKKRDNKTKSDPVLKSEAMKKQVEANARSLAKVPPEIQREKWAKSQSEYREKKEKLRTQVLTLLNFFLTTKHDEASTMRQKGREQIFKENQMKISSEIAAEL